LHFPALKPSIPCLAILTKTEHLKAHEMSTTSTQSYLCRLKEPMQSRVTEPGWSQCMSNEHTPTIVLPLNIFYSSNVHTSTTETNQMNDCKSLLYTSTFKGYEAYNSVPSLQRKSGNHQKNQLRTRNAKKEYL
jgi:hypothetical protein